MFWKILSNFSWFISLISLASGIIIIIIQVFLRYVFGFSLPWAEELARYCMIYIGMIGSALTLRESSHPSIDFIKKILTHKGTYILDLISQMATLFFAGVIIWGGYSIFMFEGFSSRTPALRILWAFPYFSISLAGVLLFFFTVEKFINMLKVKSKDK